MKKDIKIIKGDSFIFGFTLKDISSALTSAFFCVSDTYGAAYKIESTIANSGIVLVDSDGDDYDYFYRCTVPKSTTAGIDSGIYNYSLKIEYDSKKYTVIYGKCTVIENVEHV